MTSSAQSSMAESQTGYQLDASERAAIDHWRSKFPDGAQGQRSAIIQALFTVQEHGTGWLDTAQMDAVAEYLDVPPVWVYEVAAFYSMLETEPVGCHKISICTNISCMLRGAQETVDYIEQKLGIKLGETTPDGAITLKVEEECVAACVGAPMMIVDGHYHENLTPERIDDILAGLSVPDSKATDDEQD